MKRKLHEIALIALVLLLAGCNLPVIGGEQAPEATPIPTAAAATEPAEAPTAVPPTEAPEPTLEPLGDPIAHLEEGQLIIITTIHMISADLGWAIGGVNGASDHVLRTRDGGTTWQDITPAEPAPLEGESEIAAAGAFMGPSNAWVVYYPTVPTTEGGYRLRLWATSDGGDSWQRSQPLELEFLGSAEYPPMLGFTDQDNGWLLARAGPSGMHRYSVYLLRTSDAGRHWTKAIDPFEDVGLQSCHKTGLAFADLQTGWATFDNCPVPAPEIAVTHDGGITWEALALPAPESRPTLFETDLCEAHSPHLLSPMEGAVGVSCSTGDRLQFFYFTEDGGQTWARNLYPGGQLELFNRQTGYALGRKIYRTEDGGVTWDWVKTLQWDGQFSFVSEQLGWAVARSEGAIALVKTSNGGGIWDLLKPRIGP